MKNPFEALADEYQSAGAKRRERDAARRAVRLVVMSDADAPMKGNAMERARDQRNAEMKNYREAKARDRDALFEGPHGFEIKALTGFLKVMTMDNAGDLVEFVMTREWVKAMDRETRFGVLSLIGDAICKLRIRAGQPPFDDPLMGEDPNAFLIIRKTLVGI